MGLLWSELVLHHSAGEDGDAVDLAAIRAYHTAPPPSGRGWLDVGYHFVAERIGDSYEMLAGRPLSMPGAHTVGHNRTAIGVCLVGNYDLEAPPAELLRVVGRHVRGLVAAFGISRDRVLLHREVFPTACPGRYITRAVLEGLLR
jgi:hypothetical protein